jgi:hypothetical protein
MVVQHTCIARPSIPRCGAACKHRASRVITLRAHRVVENWILDDPDRLDVAHVRPVHDGLTIDFRQFLWSVSRARMAGVGRPGVSGRPCRRSDPDRPLGRSGRRRGARHRDAGPRVRRCLGIHPEGTRSRDGRLCRHHAGCPHHRRASGRCCCPRHLHHQPDRPPPLALRPHSLGDLPAPRPHAVPAGQINKRTGRAATDHLMRVLQSYSDQEYVDTYACTAQAGRPNPARPAGAAARHEDRG